LVGSVRRLSEVGGGGPAAEELAPVPFLFVRHGVISDWKFFLDNEDWLNLWARRYGESAVQALAEELRRLPWRANPAQAA
jgi:hypothetical protein